MREDIYRKMYEVEDRHWWFSAKRRIVRHLLERYMAAGDSSQPLRLADIGCGCGRALEEMPAGVSAVGLDASPTAVEYCRMRGVEAIVASLPDDVPLEESSFDAVLMADILEHVDDDAAAARAAARLLRPGGVMVVTVPAFEGLWSSWDEIHEHKRRYTRGSLAGTLSGTGLTTELISYYNSLLFLPAATVRLAKRAFRVRAAAELSLPPKWLNAILRGIFAAERHLLGRVTIPFGLSVVAVLRRPRD